MVKRNNFFGSFIFNFNFNSLRGRQNRLKLAKFIIIIGFIIVAIVVLSVFIPRAGINVEVIERTAVVGTMQTISVKISNNNFETLRGVTVQIGEEGKIQNIGDMGPFASVMISPDTGDFDFDRVTVRANEGAMEHIAFR